MLQPNATHRREETYRHLPRENSRTRSLSRELRNLRIDMNFNERNRESRERSLSREGRSSGRGRRELSRRTRH